MLKLAGILAAIALVMFMMRIVRTILCVSKGVRKAKFVASIVTSLESDNIVQIEAVGFDDDGCMCDAEGAVSRDIPTYKHPAWQQAWHDQQGLAYFREQVITSDLQYIGCYRYCGSQGVALLEAWYSENLSAYVSIMECAGLAALVQVDAETSTGQWLVYTIGGPDFLQFMPKPDHVISDYFDINTTLDTVFGRVKAEALLSPLIVLKPENFESRANQCLLEQAEFSRTTNISQRWLEALVSSTNIKLDGDEARIVNEVRQLAREERQRLQTVTECARTYAAQVGMTEAQFESCCNDLLVVHDEMSAEDVVGAVCNLQNLDESEEDGLEVLLEVTAPGRSLMKNVNRLLPNSKRMVKVGSVASPVAADIYQPQTPLQPEPTVLQA